MSEQTLEISLLHDRTGFAVGCSACQKPVLTGYWLIQIRIVEQYYVYGTVVQTKCCGRFARVVRPYGEADDATARALIIQKKLENKDLSGMCLIHNPFELA